jgi:hypothetical protein
MDGEEPPYEHGIHFELYKEFLKSGIYYVTQRSVTFIGQLLDKI